MRKKSDDLFVGVAVTVIIIAIIASGLGVRYLVFKYTPCSMFAVAEAPVRCLK